MNRFSHPELKYARALPAAPGRGVTAVLGPTNTGKTHLAIERMLAHESGMIGLPLRLLAREVYGRVVQQIGLSHVALITGEERIEPPGARFRICTVEAMPPKADCHFVAIDEVQLAVNLDRGHVFTDRLLHLRGSRETMLLGAATVRPVLEQLLPGIQVVGRPRMSQLHYAGQKKITRLPRRCAIVAFSADEVYAIAELIRRQRGAAAVVLGSLSPRTRNAQVALYQSGDVDFLVATDAIGMGLNLDVDHVAFAQDQKFDGYHHRRLKPAEFAQIAGRAGRHVRDGTFGTTGRVDPFEDELVERLESHEFPPEKVFQWRSRVLSFDTIGDLIGSLEQPARSPQLVKAPMATDQRALTAMAGLDDIRDRLTTSDRVELLWQVAQVPDYRKIAPANHADLLATLFRDLADDGVIDEDWFAAQVRQTDNTLGEIDALSTRIAHVRTWTFLSHRAGWLRDGPHWRAETRAIEDRLSDALHERLTKRFVDRRTSVLMKRLRENTMLEAEIAPTGAVMVEGHHVGDLNGFRFSADATADGPDAKAARAAAQKALAGEFEARAVRLSAAPNSDIVLDQDATLRWVGAPVGRVVAGEDVMRPRVLLLADEQLTGPARDKVAARLERWLAYQTNTLLKPLADLKMTDGMEGLARGIAFQVAENMGVVERRLIADDVKSLNQDQRAALRAKGVRFGAYHIFVPALLKPAPAGLASLLWAVANEKLDTEGREELLAALAVGRTSLPVVEAYHPAFYGLCGFRVLGRKAVRIDILERLADLIRPAISWRGPSGTGAKRPEGAWNGVGFMATPAMLSILGASHDDMADVLRGLGYRGEALDEPKIEAQLAEWDGTPTGEADNPPDEPKQQAAPEVAEEPAAKTTAEPTPSASEVTSPSIEAQTPENNSTSETVAEAAAVNQTEPEPEPEPEPERIKQIMIWRPQREDRGRGPRGRAGDNGRGRKPSGKHAGKPGGDKGQGAKRPKRDDQRGRGGGKPNTHKKPEKLADPDSPFAKLAALKANLEGKDG
ncbi:MAG: helicase-related protein [Pseudomonadota bacterium]